ncbi:hypothetical protein PAXINDRAFT_87391 [Paxillus involutus ATCC 200175]|uniref:Uncharacterized protein n=1 Tax=Paxillus involutus ATCC 200175 TaxID=664439 RepID=A0A0C9SQ83_PAXIN|nr:hypothetical protein PAXINDRAFT_87391 [Paxillus involutus ATCC 200175]
MLQQYLNVHLSHGAFCLCILTNLNQLYSLRYKKKYVLLGVIIPGPNKPKNIDFFLFPSFHHIAALQHEGPPVWDVFQDT